MRQAVSAGKFVRHREWNLFPRKEKFAMNALVSLILAAALVLGGGATAVAAQDDLPDQPLYPVKLWTENATLALTGDPQLKANLLMQMSQTRVEEMTGLVEQGLPVPDQVQDRLQDQIQQTLMLATNMNDATLTQTLLQLRDQLQTQDRIMEKLQTHASTDTEPLLTQTRSMLQTRLHLVDQGLVDPQGFRYAMANQMQYGQNEEVTPEPNQQGEPGFHQNDQGGQQLVDPSGIGAGNGASGGQNPDNSQNGNGGNGSGNEMQGNKNSDNGGCSGSNCGGTNDGGGGCSGSGCGGNDGGNGGGGNK
jgi:hypothetical protein